MGLFEDRMFSCFYKGIQELHEYVTLYYWMHKLNEKLRIGMYANCTITLKFLYSVKSSMMLKQT